MAEDDNFFEYSKAISHFSFNVAVSLKSFPSNGNF